MSVDKNMVPLESAPRKASEFFMKRIILASNGVVCLVWKDMNTTMAHIQRRGKEGLSNQLSNKADYHYINEILGGHPMGLLLENLMFPLKQNQIKTI
ncbi:hypothetical protein DMN77_07630 [Paenibacillus sp. 79R4]|uniref:hypothetical protein n=1 Tax=Paenibacillus sp. 79R4 TaxID=2212847 RepID=UPI0015BED40B|nr:hypothetical protein [Paenibacillus sp. 79R4]NWL87472.1 hypothetical protein [Paenibacillus sp. 79R4]